MTVLILGGKKWQQTDKSNQLNLTKGTDDTQRCHHLLRGRINESAHAESALPPCKEAAKGSKNTRVVVRYEIARCAVTPGLYIKHMWPATPTDLPLECWKGSFLVLSEGRTGGNASGTEGCERLPSFQCEGGETSRPPDLPSRSPSRSGKMSKTHWMSVKRVKSCWMKRWDSSTDF